MHFLGIVQWNSTRRDHSGNPEGVFGSGPVTIGITITHIKNCVKCVTNGLCH